MLVSVAESAAGNEPGKIGAAKLSVEPRVEA
jgi:hypothetical protein